MAIARSTPKCQFCGEPIATARRKNMGKNFVGDTFLGWDYFNCECEQAKKLREKRTKEAKKRLKNNPNMWNDILGDLKKRQ